MKTASGIAEEICQEFRRLAKENKGCACLFIAQALTDYGKQEYQRGHDAGFNEGVGK